MPSTTDDDGCGPSTVALTLLDSARPSAVHIAPLSVHSNVGPSEMLIRSAVTGVTVICQRRLPGGASRLALVAARVKPD